MSIQRSLPIRLSVFAATALLSLLPFAPSHADSETPHEEAIPEIDTASDAVGATPGEFSVDASGAANYTIPIFTVPAPGGVAPQLALTYSSRGGHGPLGVGWGISGTSSIERCRQTKEHGDGNGPHPPVNFSATDVFCLDGQRLIQIATPTTNPPANCPNIGLTVVAEFRTEIESFARICAYQGDSISNGPSRFTVERRDGSTAQYGFDPDARVEPNYFDTVNGAWLQRSGVVMRWAVNRIRQPTGAYIDFDYLEDSVLGDHRLDKVRYTGNDQTGATTKASVEFVYAAMPSQGQRVDYVAGSKLELKQRLTKVNSYAWDSATVVRSYELCYDDATSCFGAPNSTQSTASQRLPRVLAVQECGKNADLVGIKSACREPTRFEWTNPTPGYATIATSGTWFSHGVSDQRIGDFNGDGRDDLVLTNQATGVLERSPDQTIAVNYDVMVLFGTSVSASHPLGIILPPQGSELKAPVTIYGGQCFEAAPNSGVCGAFTVVRQTAAKYHVYDFNADGRDDLLISASDGTTKIYLSTDNGNEGITFQTGMRAIEGSNELGEMFDSQLVDVDGDGLPDLIYRLASSNNSGATNQTRVRLMQRVTAGGPLVYQFGPELANGISLSAGLSVVVDDDSQLPLSHATTIAHDMDSDGRADFLMRLANTNGGVDWYVLRNAGVSGGALNLVEVQKVGYGNLHGGRVAFSDLNGDGLADVVVAKTIPFGGNPQPLELVYRLNRGGSFAATETSVVLTATGHSGPWGDTSATSPNRFRMPLSDVNDDGYQDIVYAPSGTSPQSCGASAPSWCVARTLKVLLGSATGFSATPVDAGVSEFGANTMDGVLNYDVDGDGDLERMRYVKEPNTNNIYGFLHLDADVAYRNSTIHTITDGLSAQVRVDYAPLTHSSVYKRHTGASSLEYGKESPVFDTFSPMAVVKSVKRSMPTHDDAENMHEMRYQYRGARVQAGGRGFLGFERRTEIDVPRELVTTVQYRQDYPFIGRVAATWSGTGSVPTDACASGADAPGCLIYSSGTDGDLIAGDGTCISESSSDYTASFNAAESIQFPFATQTTRREFSATGVELSQLTEAWSYTDDTLAACVVGTCGNLSQTTKTWRRVDADTPVDELRETTTHTYDVNSNFATLSRWQLGLIAETSVQRERLSDQLGDPAQDDVTRTEQFKYDGKGLLSQTITEPSGGGSSEPTETQKSLFLRTQFSRDPWGNVLQTRRCSIHFSETECSNLTGFSQQQWQGDLYRVMRYATTTWSTDGRFPVAQLLPYFDPANATNRSVEAASSRIESADRDLLGNPRRQTDEVGVATERVFGVFGQEQFMRHGHGSFGYTKVRDCGGTTYCPTGAKYRVEQTSYESGTYVEDSATSGGAVAPLAFTYFDMLGREVLSTKRMYHPTDANKRWSSVLTRYDAVGRVDRVSVPYFSADPATASVGAVLGATQNGTCSTLPAESSECWTHRSYEALDRVEIEKRPDLSGTAKTQFTYDEAPREVKQVTDQGVSGSTVTHKTLRNGVGETVSVKESNNTTSTLRHTAFGELAMIAKSEMLDGSISKSIALSANFDLRGRKIASTDPDKGMTEHKYNALGELVWSEDALGNTDTISYDALGREIRRAQHYSPDANTIFVDRDVIRRFDSRGAIAAASPPGSTTTPPELVVNGDFATQSGGWTWAATWQSTGGHNNSGSALIGNNQWLWQYIVIDPALQYKVAFWNKLTAGSRYASTANAELEVAHYSNAGTLLQTDRIRVVQNGVIVLGQSVEASVTPHAAARQLRLQFKVSGMVGLTMTVDNVSLTATTIYPRNPVSTWNVAGGSLLGRVAYEEDAVVQFRKDYHYDSLGRMVVQSTHHSDSGRWHPSLVEFDKYGRVLRQYDPDRRLYNGTQTTANLTDGTEFEYSRSGWLIKDVDLRTETRLRELRSQTARGQAAIELLSNYSEGNFEIKRVFDERTGLQTSQSAMLGTTEVQDLIYSYDKAGNVVERINLIANKREKFSYDTLNRLWQVHQTNDVSSPSPTVWVDTMTLGYDTFGNVRSKTVKNAENAGAPGITQNYSYCADNACGQPHAVKSMVMGGASGATHSYVYDAIGQQRSLTRDRVDGATYRTRRLIRYDWMRYATRINSYDLIISNGQTSVDPNGIDALQMFDYAPDGSMIWRSTTLQSGSGAVLPVAKNGGGSGNGNGNGRGRQHEDEGLHLGHAYGHDPEFLAALDEMDETDVQRPLKYPALRRPLKSKQPKAAAKATCPGTPDALPTNDIYAEIFGNTEMVYAPGDCDIVARRRSVGGYVTIEQRRNWDPFNFGEINWSENSATIYTYQLTDPLGSVDVQVRMTGANNTYTASTDQANRNPRRMSFDVHGQQRNAGLDLNGDGDYTDTSEVVPWTPIVASELQRTRTEGTWRGYAGHETYNAVGIVHMKGRIYDPLLGRFLQPDPIVEDDLNPQTWNRYTYVRNNPMTFTDPTGFATHREVWEERWRKLSEKLSTFWGAFGGVGSASQRGSNSDSSGFGTITPKGSSANAHSDSPSGIVSVGELKIDEFTFPQGVCAYSSICRGFVDGTVEAYNGLLSIGDPAGVTNSLTGGLIYDPHHRGEDYYLPLPYGGPTSEDERTDYEGGKMLATLAGARAMQPKLARPTTNRGLQSRPAPSGYRRSPRPTIDASDSSSNSTRLGVTRTNAADWRGLRDLWDDLGYGQILSSSNRERIARGRTPLVDDEWVAVFPEDAGLIGERISQHHIGGYPITVPLPVTRHMDAHMPGGFRYNPGGPGAAVPFYLQKPGN